MWTYPTGFQAALESRVIQHAWVVELELEAGTAYFAEEPLTWNGNTYSKLLTDISSIVNHKNPERAPTCVVTLDNVPRALQTQLATDLIAEREARVRFLIRDGAGWKAGSVSPIRGIAQRPRKVTETAIEFEILGPLHGSLAPMPGARRFGRQCEWTFKDGVNCNYVGAETSCTHEIADCAGYGRLHEYGGFPGIEDTQSIALAYYQRGDRIFPVGNGPLAKITAGAYRKFTADLRNDKLVAEGIPEGLPAEEREKVVPVLFGRRLIPGKVAESSGVKYEIDPNSYIAVVHALSEGEIEGIVDFYVDGSRGVNKSPVNGKTFGIYFVPGSIGLDDDETIAEFLADLSTLERAQNRSYYYITDGITYSRTAVAVMIQRLTDIAGDTAQVPEFDVKGLLLQAYTSGGSTDGSPAFSRNPIWQAVNSTISARYGLGRHWSASDIDFAVTEPASNVCDATVYGNYVDVVDTTDDDTGGVYDVWEVADTAPFTRGMTVEVDENGTPTEATVVNIWSPTVMRLSYDKENPTAPARVRPKLSRFTCDLYLDTSTRFSRTLAQILDTCDGYVTYDQDGLIQFRVSQAGASVATFKDTGADEGYAILDFEWLMTSVEGQSAGYTNRVVASFTNQENEGRDAVANDFDHRTTHDVRTETLSLDGVDSRNQAYRIAKRALDRNRLLLTGAVMTVGPIGMGLQCGDLITVTHADAGWTDEVVEILKTELLSAGSGQNECFVKLTVADYNAAVYSDAPEPIVSSPISSPTPAITLTATGLTGGKVKLSWTKGDGIGHPLFFKVWKADSTMSGDPLANGELLDTLALGSTYVYTAESDEIGTALYFMVTAKVGPFQAKNVVKSNEATVTPFAMDPADSEDLVAVNTFYDGSLQLPDFWLPNSGPQPTLVAVTPDAHSGTYTNPTLAYDGAQGTRAYASGGSHSLILTLPGTDTNQSCYWEVKHKTTGYTIGGATSAQNFYWSNDGGSTWNLFATSSTSIQTSKSTSFIGDFGPGANEIQIKAEHTGANASSFFEATLYHWSSSGAVCIVSGGEALLRGDGVSTHGVLACPWPGQDGKAEKVIPIGSNWTGQFKARRIEGAPDFPVELFLHHVPTMAYITIASFEASEISMDTLRAVANAYTAASTLGGPWLGGVRTLSTKAVSVTDLHLCEGHAICQPGQHPNEIKKDRATQQGIAKGWPRGGWTGLQKYAEVIK